MRELTAKMIKEFRIADLGYDFMGYTYKKLESLSFHHLIVPRRNCEKNGFDTGYYDWNGAILVRNTAHVYLHIIEKTDPEVFFALTSEMIDENINRAIRLENLRRIRDLLKYFEHEHIDDVNRKGSYIIKPIYMENRIPLNRL